MTQSSQVAAALKGCAVHPPAADLLHVSGKDHVDLLQRISANDVKGLEPGRWHWNCCTSAKGKLVDRVRILRSEDALLVLATAGRGAAVAEWIDLYTILEDVAVETITGGVRLLHLVGPDARAVAAAVTGVEAEAFEEWTFREAEVAGKPATVLSTDGTGRAPGVLLLVPYDVIDAVRSAAVDAGATPIDDAAWEAIRVTTGLPRVGVDVGEDRHPLEAGLWDGVSFDKGCYVGQEVLARLRNYDKIQRHLVTLDLDGDAAAGAELVADGKPVGTLTTVVGPPWLEAPRALGYVKRRTIQAGKEITVGADGPAARVDEIVSRGSDTR